MYSETFSILDKNAEKPADGVKALQTFEETSRKRRETLKKEFEAAIATLSEDARKAFQEEAKKRVDPIRAQISVAVRRYPQDVQAYVRQLVTTIFR